MPFEYVNIDEAIERPGLRMMVISGVPSGWGEAAKGIFHVKGIEWTAARLAYDNARLKGWAGMLSAPVAIYNDESPRPGWTEILMLAERLASKPALLPSDPTQRALAFGLAHELCGEAGLGWSRRLQLVHASLSNQGGFIKPIATYLGNKYGYHPVDGALWGPRVVVLLDMLTARLKAQHKVGSAYYVGDSLSAVDIYSAAFMAMFAPLPEAHCNMDAGIRAAFQTLDAPTQAALNPILLEHRDMMYQRHLELPLSL